jgi:hypothetical protein
MTTNLRAGRRRRSAALALVTLGIGGVLIAIEVWQGAPVGRAIGGFAILVAFVAVVLLFQTRSETVSTLAGSPVDERWRLIHTQALAGAANFGAVVGLVGYGVTELMGGDNWQFAVMTLVISVGYLGGLAWYRWRL